MLLDTKERQYQQMLRYSGQAFIIFGIWSIVKIVLQLTLDPLDWSSVDALDDISKHFLQTLTYIVMAVLLAADILIRMYIGFSAIREAKGKRKRIVYLIVAALYIIGTIAAFIPNEYDTNYENENNFATVFFDATNAVALVMIIVSSWNLRKLRKQ